MVRVAVGLALTLFLAACGALPRPFLPPPDHPYPLSQMPLDETVAVSPVSGVALPMGKLLAARVADELTTYGVPAVAQPVQGAGYVLQGHAEPAPPGLPYVVVVTWRLLSEAGIDLGYYRHGVGGEWWQWDYGSPAVIEAVGEHAGEPLAKMILGDRYDGPTSPMPQQGVWFAGVKGAPGDGDEALARALGRALRDRGIPVTSDADASRYHLSGTVDVSPPEDGHQIVRIAWRLAYPDGREIGVARQRNAVAAGSLDRRWRETATYAATAAVGGINDLIRRAEPRLGAGEIPGGQGLRRPIPAEGRRDGPPSPDLPQVPGRALPPS